MCLGLHETSRRMLLIRHTTISDLGIFDNMMCYFLLPYSCNERTCLVIQLTGLFLDISMLIHFALFLANYKLHIVLIDPVHSVRNVMT